MFSEEAYTRYSFGARKLSRRPHSILSGGAEVLVDVPYVETEAIADLIESSCDILTGAVEGDTVAGALMLDGEGNGGVCRELQEKGFAG